MWKLIFFTGVGALMLGVVQNLPKPEVVEIDYAAQIRDEYNNMENRLNAPQGNGSESISR